MSVENVVESVECFPQGNMGGREQEETDMVMRWKRMREGAQAPQRQTEGSAGFDLQACVEAPVTLQPGDSYRFPPGIACEIPQGCAGLIFTRSGLGFKKGVAVRNGVGRHRQRLPGGAPRGPGQLQQARPTPCPRGSGWPSW